MLRDPLKYPGLTRQKTVIGTCSAFRSPPREQRVIFRDPHGFRLEAEKRLSFFPP